MNGTVGRITINDTYYVALIGLDHNMSVESGGKHNAHFKFPYDKNGKQLAFVDDCYGKATVTSGSLFCINYGGRYADQGGTTGGYNGSSFHETCESKFFTIFPSAWQAVITTCTKYTDNVGDKNTSASGVTAGTYNVVPLSEFEYFGFITGANSAEQNYQEQYEYYLNGASKAHRSHINSSTLVDAWTRSPNAKNALYFVAITTGGVSGGSYAYASRGISLLFQIS